MSGNPTLDFIHGLLELAYDEKWITTENGHRVLLSDDGTVEAGFGGKFTGQKISKVGGGKGKSKSEKTGYQKAISETNKQIKEAKSEGDTERVQDLRGVVREYKKKEKELGEIRAKHDSVKAELDALKSNTPESRAAKLDKDIQKSTDRIAQIDKNIQKAKDRQAQVKALSAKSEELFASRDTMLDRISSDYKAGKIDSQTYKKRRDTIRGLFKQKQDEILKQLKG